MMTDLPTMKDLFTGKETPIIPNIYKNMTEDDALQHVIETLFEQPPEVHKAHLLNRFCPNVAESIWIKALDEMDVGGCGFSGQDDDLAWKNINSARG